MDLPLLLNSKYFLEYAIILFEKQTKIHEKKKKPSPYNFQASKKRLNTLFRKFNHNKWQFLRWKDWIQQMSQISLSSWIRRTPQEEDAWLMSQCWLPRGFTDISYFIAKQFSFQSWPRETEDWATLYYCWSDFLDRNACPIYRYILSY